MAYAILEDPNMLALLTILRTVAQEYGPEGIRIQASSVVCSAHPGLKAAVRVVWPHATLSSSLTLLCEVRSIYRVVIYICML